MATKYVTLKDSNGDTLYPQAVATNLAPGSIKGNEIDWSDVAAHYSDNSGARQSTAYADGTLITTRIVPITSQAVTTQWGSIYRGEISGNYSLAPSASPDFIEKPTVTAAYYAGDNLSAWLGTLSAGGIGIYSSNNRWTALQGCFQLFRATSGTVSGEIHVTAIGRWK